MMPKIFRNLLITIAATLLCVVPSALANVAKGDFNLDEAKGRYTEISQSLTAENLSIDDLTTAVNELNQLQLQSDDCILKAKTQIDLLSQLIGEAQKELGIDPAQKEWKAIDHKKAQLSEAAGACKLFSFELSEAIKSYNKTIAKMTAAINLSKKTHFIYMAQPDNLRRITWDASSFFHHSGLKTPSSRFLGGLGVSLLLGILLALSARNGLGKIIGQTSRKKKYRYFLLKNIYICSPYLITLTAPCLYLAYLYADQKRPPILFWYFVTALSYAASLFVGSLLIYRPNLKRPIFKFSKSVRKKLFLRFQVIVSVIFAFIAISASFQGQRITNQVADAYSSVAILLVSLLILWAVWTIVPSALRRGEMPSNLSIAKYVLSLVIGGILLSEVLGYHTFALHIMEASSKTIGLLWLTTEAIRAIELIFIQVEENRNVFSKKLYSLLGIRYPRKILETLLLRLCVYLPLVLVTFLYILRSWDASPGMIDALEKGFYNGFKFADIDIVPFKILMGVVSFCLILFLSRFLSSRITRSINVSDDTLDNQVALASLVTYIGFALAAIVGMIIAGVNFTGLAIIAGALSVGIGFGLQHIANNFISGILLLLQSPIKSGDRISIGDKEGFVKKISLLSTQLTTLRKEDIILPNSDLITSPVTNYMFSDKLGRVINQVGVAYGSNVELVTELLLKVAEAHKEILTSGKDKPGVLFKEFGSSALNFELWSVVRNVNLKYRVHSELNYAIERIFRENGITIAFPQLDVHMVREAPDTPSNSAT